MIFHGTSLLKFHLVVLVQKLHTSLLMNVSFYIISHNILFNIFSRGYDLS